MREVARNLEQAARPSQRPLGSRLDDMPEFIYQMRGVRKAHGNKVILDEVTLAFLPGAKIGVVGPNGTGKSTLLRMMAGVEQPSNGDAKLMPGYTVGLLAQEPELDENKTVLGHVEDGVAETKRLLNAYNEVAEKMAREAGVEIHKTLLDGKAFQKVLNHARNTEPWLLVVGRTGRAGEHGVASTLFTREQRSKGYLIPTPSC